MKIIIRVLKFDRDDWNHLWFLVKTLAKNYWDGDLNGVTDVFWWIRIHLLYDSKRIY